MVSKILYAQFFSNSRGSLPLGRSKLERMMEILHLVQKVELPTSEYKWGISADEEKMILVHQL